MGDKTTQTSRWALCGRIIVYGSPAVTSILFVITFYQLALYQARLQQLEQSIANERDSNGMQQNTEAIPAKSESLLRNTRTSGGDKGMGVLDDYFGKIAELQVSEYMHGPLGDGVVQSAFMTAAAGTQGTLCKQ